MLAQGQISGMLNQRAVIDEGGGMRTMSLARFLVRNARENALNMSNSIRLGWTIREGVISLDVDLLCGRLDAIAESLREADAEIQEYESYREDIA